MFNGYDFVFDGKSSMSENLKLMYWDRNAFNSENGIPNKTISTFKTNRSSKWRISGVKQEEPLSFTVEMHFHQDEDEYTKRNPVIKRNHISKINNWLFDRVTYKRFQIMSPDMRDLYFMVIFNDVEYLKVGGEVTGFKATAICNSTGAYEDKVIEKNCNGITKIKFQCLQDGIQDITPTYKITLGGSGITIDVNGEVMKLKSLTSGSTVTIDTETLIVGSTVHDNLFIGDRFNKIYPTLRNGINEITVTGNCLLEVNYSLSREVGS